MQENIQKLETKLVNPPLTGLQLQMVSPTQLLRYPNLVPDIFGENGFKPEFLTYRILVFVGSVIHMRGDEGVSDQRE